MWAQLFYENIGELPPGSNSKDVGFKGTDFNPHLLQYRFSIDLHRGAALHASNLDAVPLAHLMIRFAQFPHAGQVKRQSPVLAAPVGKKP